jgi:hypothetical protein
MVCCCYEGLHHRDIGCVFRTAWRDDVDSCYSRGGMSGVRCQVTNREAIAGSEWNENSFSVQSCRI